MAARDRLDLNLSTTFAELATTSINMWGRERELVMQKDRGSYAPYRILNRTGSPLFIWSDTDASSGMQESNAVKLNHDQIIDWRFDDWKMIREVGPATNFFSHQLINFPARFDVRTTQHRHSSRRETLGGSSRHSS